MVRVYLRGRPRPCFADVGIHGRDCTGDAEHTGGGADRSSSRSVRTPTPDLVRPSAPVAVCWTWRW
jgi:hypothetical protein